MGNNVLFLALIAAFVLMIFFTGRKQRKAMAQQQELQNSLTAGDRVMTSSGLYGTVVETDEDTIDIEIADGVVTTWLRAAVREKVQETVALDEADEVTHSADTEASEEIKDVVEAAKKDENSK
ncbi:preprotein translocase subunit YajC [Pseudonocardiaceae bacterium YIM PH 21723]|nr:preprotein translocase subunit YajC [Pseudonocardiaceae bacterium YIM PH 21723]